MIEEGFISHDTSYKNYPYNKYFNTKQLKKIKKELRSKTIDHGKPLKKVHCKNKKSLMSTKTMSSSRMRGNSSYMRGNSRHNYQTIVPITSQNYKAFTKEDIANELHHYKDLCLELRKQNYSLESKLDEKSRGYKDSIADLEKKINKFNQKSLELKEKQLLIQRKKIVEERKGLKKGKMKPHRNLQGQFKRFFLHFIDNCSKIDEKVKLRVIHQKNMEQKLLLSQRLLQEGSQYLLEKKFKFKSIYL